MRRARDMLPIGRIAERTGMAVSAIRYYEAEGDDPPYLVATLPEQLISATGIWIGEELATRAALSHGFAPDGWGLES